MTEYLDGDLDSSGPESAFFLERQLMLEPGESRSMYFLYGYLPKGFELGKLISKYTPDIKSLWSQSTARWSKDGLKFRTSSEPWVERETAWSSYYLRSGLTYDNFFKEHILSQGQGYQYLAGLQGAARDPLQHALPFVFTDPQIVREILRYTLKEIQPDGSLPYAIVGSGVSMPCRYQPSDQELWLLWLASEYVMATRDQSFLNERIGSYPDFESSQKTATVLELLKRTYERITTKIGFGRHGLIRLFNGDWNDSIVVNRLGPAEVADVHENGESVLNSAMACYVLKYYARMLDYIGDGHAAKEASITAETQRELVRKQWVGKWFRRAWLGEKLGWLGEKQLWLEPQPWALIGGAADDEQAKALLTALNELVRRPSPVGALLQNEPDPTMKDEPGVGTNGGVFAAINGTLIWALAQESGTMAWDEWKKNSLARHADTYPEMWFNIWSGPDAFDSVLAKRPGWTPPDFPVMNLHPHAWPLYSSTKLLGLEFHATGLNFRSDLPLADYELSSSLVGFRKSSRAYSGWYSPESGGLWEIRITLKEAERLQLRQVSVNGVRTTPDVNAQEIRFSGRSSPGSALRWEITLGST
jgi:hypothetical protein